MSGKNSRIQLRDKAIEQLLLMLRPFQIVALNIGDVAYDDGRLFLRVLNRRDNPEQYRFDSVSLQTQRDLETFLVDSRPLYEEKSEALFLSRFGRRLTARSIRMRHGRTSQKLVERKIVEINEPCGKDGIDWFDKWSRARVVYVMQRQDGTIKIGHSMAGLATRFQTLESEYGQMRLLGLIEGDSHLEGKIQMEFCHLLVEGKEWFRPDPELLAFVQRVVKEGRDGLPLWMDYRKG